MTPTEGNRTYAIIVCIFASLGSDGGVLVMESFLNDFCVGWHGQMMADCSRATERLPQRWVDYTLWYNMTYNIGCMPSIQPSIVPSPALVAASLVVPLEWHSFIKGAYKAHFKVCLQYKYFQSLLLVTESAIDSASVRDFNTVHFTNTAREVLMILQSRRNLAVASCPLHCFQSFKTLSEIKTRSVSWENDSFKAKRTFKLWLIPLHLLISSDTAYALSPASGSVRSKVAGLYVNILVVI
ncbi:hypothetical protein PsorP6_007429 [Peronosclerospora sorghi]|uniref:Uncharacterized protein n=1 Tax=Peronosclerospora sorghi TaxID=230839 RepID=A0ACC0WCD9_9STRA|nr:hypothetical protein PsorP6_007429 [Peronosclerospora sorghi]